MLGRSTYQLAIWRGHPQAVHVSVVLGLAGLYYFGDGTGDGLLLTILGVLPGVLLMIALKEPVPEALSGNLYLEMFWTGCFVSVFVAIVLEVMFHGVTLPLWICGLSSEGTSQCSIILAVTIVVAVGAVEEFAKLLVIGRVATREKRVPLTWPAVWRFVDTEAGMLLCGVASGAGFATLENLRYIRSSAADSFDAGLATSFLRACVAVPFHVVLTGFASGVCAKGLFNSGNISVGMLSPVWLRRSNRGRRGMAVASSRSLRRGTDDKPGLHAFTD
ncbi:MAG: hypothetical protein KVP17_002795 [Porospora cf. gigantea B]|uniref:uncharacterized protein n=1 Tax=Porospora cf. gigantea B TaxID=2853592 RepID=UPI003571F258|nr:MAG: hypothetical protein KVP17_002795 [Porospora cf. gigantea B]